MSNLTKRPSVEVLPPLPSVDLRISFHNRGDEALIRKLQSITGRRAVAIYFERNGCLHCGGRALPHAGNALCTKCRRHVYYELDKIEKEIKSGEFR
jgi:hypothetical protein